MTSDLDSTLEVSFDDRADNVEKLLYKFTIFSLSAYAKQRVLLPEKSFRRIRIEGHHFWLFNPKDAEGNKLYYSVKALEPIFRDRTIAGLSLITYDEKTKWLTDKLSIDFALPDNSDTSTVMSNSSVNTREAALRQLYKIAALGTGLDNVERRVGKPYSKKLFLTVRYKQPKTERIPVLCYVPLTPERTIYNTPRNLQTHVVASFDAGDGNQVNVTYESTAFFQRDFEDIVRSAANVADKANLKTCVSMEPFMVSPF